MSSSEPLVAAVAGEDELLAEIDGDAAWSVVERFAGLVRETGTEGEQRAANLIVERLQVEGISHRVYEPELLISLPRSARLVVDGRDHAAKTPSLAGSTDGAGVTAPLVYQPLRTADSLTDMFASPAADIQLVDVKGKIVVVDGLQFPGIIPALEEAGASAVVCISPSTAIHESACSTIWGSPDLTSWSRRCTIPVLNVSNESSTSLRARSSAVANATVVATHHTGWVKAPVIVATIEGTEEPDRFVLLHGHLDSWHVGIGDNATGDAALVELAHAFHRQRKRLPRSLRIAWWPGHSQGRYAGSTWYADKFALDIEDNCICHINCDSPGCRDADAFDEVEWMAELGPLAESAIFDVTGTAGAGIDPPRAGDLSFSNIGVSSAFMASSVIPANVRRDRGLYAVGGCGGNTEWHTEADTIEVADRKHLLRDIRIYASATFRAVASPVHPLDFRRTVEQLDGLLRGYATRLGQWIDLGSSRRHLTDLGQALDRLYDVGATAATSTDARNVNDALLSLSRGLVPILYAHESRYRQDPAISVPLLPDFAYAEAATGTVPEGVLRTELMRCRNRLDRALIDASRRCKALTT
jgi:N-acetylated-alpha-linked acidic dipeptidase